VVTVTYETVAWYAANREPRHEILEILLPGSIYSFHVVIPLPPRGNLWPKRDTNAKFYRVRDDAGKISYRVSLMPVGHDSYWLRKFLIEQGTESLLSKAGAFFFTGLLGPVLAGVATIFVPGETDKVLTWQYVTNDGNGGGGPAVPVIGVSSGFNV